MLVFRTARWSARRDSSLTALYSERYIKHFYSMASTRDREKAGFIQMTICFPDLSDALLSAVRSQLRGSSGLLAVEDGGGRASLVRWW